MAVILEIKSGPLISRRLQCAVGQMVVVGRAEERAQFAVPHDNLMSGVHFAVECGPGGCRVIDKKSTNGTFLNGARIQEAVLANGDEIKSGQTIFVVHIVPDGQLSASASTRGPAAQIAPVPVVPPVDTANSKSRAPAAAPSADAAHAKSSSPAAAPAEAANPKAPAAAAPSVAPSAQPLGLAIGGWVFPKIPDGWQIQEGFGIQQVVKDAFPAGIAATEEPLGAGITLAQYVEAHTKMFREHLPEPKVDAVAPPAIRDSEETAALEIRFTIKDGPAVYWRRVYARSGSIIGVLMLTTLEKDLSSVRPIYDSVLSAISFSHNQQP